MSSGLGQLNESGRMEEQQVGNDSRLSLDQRFSSGGRRSSARLRHQSLDRGIGPPVAGPAVYLDSDGGQPSRVAVTGSADHRR